MDIQVIVKAVPEILTQLLAFLLVFWILKKFAFKPVLGMIDKRRKTIEDAFAEIERQKRQLDGLEKDYRTRLDHIEQEARAKIQEASREGQALARDIQDEARSQARQILERAKEEIEQEMAKARLTMRDQIVELSSLMTEKVLRERLDLGKQDQLVDQFIRELEGR